MLILFKQKLMIMNCEEIRDFINKKMTNEFFKNISELRNN